MSTVLALETDDRRTEFLRGVVCERLRASLVVADTSEAAVAAISSNMPDVVLVSHDFPPRDEIEIKNYLRNLRRSGALEIIKMPAPSPPSPPTRARKGLLGAWRNRTDGASGGNGEREDAAVLARRIGSALGRVRAALADASAQGAAPHPTPGRGAVGRTDPRVRASAGSSTPGATLQASRSDEGAGRLPMTPAASGEPALSPPGAADGNQDEWGFFDPGRCGYAALAATLGTLPEEVQQDGEPNPADMLLKLETETGPAERAQPPAIAVAIPECRQTSVAVRGERRRDQPAPLALWAHLFGREGERSESSTLLRYTEAMAGVAALLVGLNSPAQIAAVAYASGCRIHRVRGLIRTEPTAPVTFEVASSQSHLSSLEPDPSISGPALSDSGPAA